MVELGGHLATNAGVAISGAAVAVFPTSVNATQATSTDCATTTTTTTSGGDWSVSGLAANTYDVRITCGSSVRWRRYVEEVQITTGTLANLDVDGTVDADVTDFDVLSSGDIDLVSSANTAAAVYIAQSTGTSATIKIHADTGTSVTEGAESINILSDVGGIGLRSTANLANAINLTVDGGTTSSMTLFNDQGTGNTEGSASIQLLSDAGGINIKSTADLAGSVRLTADGGTSETIILHADQGTSVTEGAESISLLSDAGGIGLRSTANLANAINLTVDSGTTSSITVFNDTGTSVTEGAESISLLSDAGGVGIRSTANLANAVNITVDGGTTSTIQIYNDQGTAVNEGVASIQLLSDVGGIGVKSGLNAAGAIRLTADAGTSETIILHADQGSGVDSIHLLSDAGGITLNPGTFVTIGGIADGEIRLMEDSGAGTEYVAIKAQNMGASYTLTLPADDGCACEVLTTNGSGVLDWAAAGGASSGWTRIGTAVASCSASLTIDGLDSTYDTYMILLQDLHPEGDGKDLWFRLGDSGGIDSGTCDYAYHSQSVRSSDACYRAIFSDGAAFIELQKCTGTAAGEGAGAVIFLHQPGDGVTRPFLTGTQANRSDGGSMQGGAFVAQRTAVITTTQVQVLFASCAIATGRMTVYGAQHA